MNYCKVIINTLVFCGILSGGAKAFGSDHSTEAPEIDNQIYPIGQPGLVVTYQLQKDSIPESTVKHFSIRLGQCENRGNGMVQWMQLRAGKANGEQFSVWILTRNYPSPSFEIGKTEIARYILCIDDHGALEYRNQYTEEAILPVLGAWEFLFPQPIERDAHTLFSSTMKYLGNVYKLERRNMTTPVREPEEIKILSLLPNALIGVPHNTRQKDETRRYDDSEYEYIRLSKEDYREMIEAGMTCFRVDREQAQWIQDENVFYWGLNGKDIQYPETLYRSNYLGPLLFLDEPAVCTRDHVIRPRLRENADFRKTITPEDCYHEFQQYFDKENHHGHASVLIQALKNRQDVDTGDKTFQQKNLYTWETFVSSALYQLSEDIDGPPSSIVFEPPGRIGSRRTLPEMNMVYSCQIPVDSPKQFIDIIYGFLRGAARSAGKSWGTSIYGSVDRDDAFGFLTHAYDLGGELFFFWDTHRLACVPFHECLALSRNLRNHIRNHPYRDLQKRKQAAEIAILIPPGYNLGHVHMGRGNLWGVGELNLERKNRKGIPYRAIMSNFFIEIERCLRLGIAFDLCWDFPSFQSEGYREIVHIREDGTLEVDTGSDRKKLLLPRIPSRPKGVSPQLDVKLSVMEGSAPLEVSAHAYVTEGSSLVYYTPGANQDGIYVNTKVLWELYGPNEEDYRTLSHPFGDVKIKNTSHQSIVEIQFTLDHPGKYRLRAATCDLAGRTSAVWKTITVQ